LESDTEFAGHAGEMVSKIQIGAFDGIVCVSGDGLIHEVINGLMGREDWAEAIKIPVGTIPAGSGNALAAELEILDPVTASFAIAKGTSRPLDLLQVTQEGQPDLYSFLSINWGLISDVDFESEAYRFIGGARFTVGALVRITNLRTYPAKLEYVLADNDGDNYFCKRDRTCIKCKSMLERDNEAVPVESKEEIQEKEENWEVLESQFVTVVGCNFSKLSYDLIVAPFAHLSDGCIDLLVVETCTRSELISLFTGMETGEFINNVTFNTGKFVKYLKVKKFKLSPLSKTSSPFGFDGEHAKSQKALTVVNRYGLATILG